MTTVKQIKLYYYAMKNSFNFVSYLSWTSQNPSGITNNYNNYTQIRNPPHL